MSALRILLLIICAAFLADCAATFPLSLAQEKHSTMIAQTEPLHTTDVTREAKKPELKPKQAKKPMSVDKDSQSSTTDSQSSTTPNVDSPEWKKEQADNERKEKHLKQVIEGICRGC
jgi:hypothetical protein